ncbi:hypothetical protein K457DRAFT_24959 [Linnemannia elongata AG-77]|uniref:Uncharacterized protein n=1 Tax=Linnemannia elongata AG-77 TaxID=1314771 RepID=A0A197JF00_9FUNG|nr:hypothetical protein K457DRAFT_24959 [Linnemannia elongata AG-77]
MCYLSRLPQIDHKNYIKNYIKNKKALHFADVAADELILQRVSIPDEDDKSITYTENIKVSTRILISTMSPGWVSRGLLSSSWKVRLPTMARLISLEYKAEQILDPYCTTQDAYAGIFGRPRLMWMLNNNTSLTRVRLKGCDI